jgi:hypothetical protein
MTPAELDAIRERTAGYRTDRDDRGHGHISTVGAPDDVIDLLATVDHLIADSRDSAALLDVVRVERDVARAEAGRYRIEVEASQLQVRDLADLLDAARTERDKALLEAAEWKERVAEKFAEIKSLRTQVDLLVADRSERIGEALQLGADLAEANSQRDLLRRRVEEVIVERDTALIARDDARRIIGEWEDEIDRRDATVRKLRRSRAKWRRRANRTTVSWIEVPDGATGRESVLGAAVGWYRTMPTMPDPDIFSRPELALHAAVAAWLQTPAAPAEPAGETPTGLDAQERTPEAAESGVPRPRLSVNWHTATAGPRLAATTLRARSCPTCHSIGDPRDGCTDPWHTPDPYVVGDQVLGEWPGVGPLPQREPGAGLHLDADIPVSPVIIIDGGDADTYLAGLFNAEAATLARLFNAEASPVPVNRADPDGAADDDWTGDEPAGGEWRHRDPNNSTTLTANTYPYGGGRPDHGVQITIERDRPGPGDPDRRTWQCLRLPHPNAVGLALWILAHYDEWSDIPADRAALDAIGDILNTASGYLEDDSPIVARLTAYLRDRQAQLDDWIGHNQRVRDALGIGPNEDTIAAIRRLRDDDESEPLREL